MATKLIGLRVTSAPTGLQVPRCGTGARGGTIGPVTLRLLCLAAACSVSFAAAPAATDKHKSNAAVRPLRNTGHGVSAAVRTPSVRTRSPPAPMVRPAYPAEGTAKSPVPFTAEPAAPAAAAAPTNEFARFVEDLWPDAEKRGVSRATFDAAFKGVTLDKTTVRLTLAGQSEFAAPVWQYLAGTVAPAKIAAGKSKQARWKQSLDRMESDFGVPREIVVAVWGIESGYGAVTGDRSVIRSLASLAFIKYRDGMFRDELLDALRILQAGDIAPARMRGSWAGAMGQTQFMPSSFWRYAVDYDGDNRRDIWADVPDALGSTANFLRSEGWDPDLSWGFEVILPKNFDASHREQTTLKPMSEWQARGLTRPAGVALPQKGTASLLIPAGLHGPAFLVTPNFKVIKAYNASTAYALAVALLAEGIAGHPSLSATWPVGRKSLGSQDTRDLQRRLKALGYDVGEADGIAGERVRDAILAFEAKRGLPQEGVAAPTILEKVRAEK